MSKSYFCETADMKPTVTPNMNPNTKPKLNPHLNIKPNKTQVFKAVTPFCVPKL